MTEKKLRDYLKSRPATPTTPKILIPVVYSDSKGQRLKNQVLHPLEQNVVWWGDSGDTLEKAIDFLRQKLPIKIPLLGQIHLYILLGTCDLTQKDKKGYISLDPHPESRINYIIQKYVEIKDIIQEYPGSKVTFLETPVYSISIYNSNRGFHDPTQFSTQDRDLIDTISKLNARVKALNQELGVIAPNFNKSLYGNTKHKNLDRCTYTQRYNYNFNLFSDGLHPTPLLSRVWLQKLVTQMRIDCWL